MKKLSFFIFTAVMALAQQTPYAQYQQPPQYQPPPPPPYQDPAQYQQPVQPPQYQQPVQYPPQYQQQPPPQYQQPAQYPPPPPPQYQQPAQPQQQQALENKHGIRLGAGLNSFDVGESGAPDFDMGYSFGGGLVASYPLSSIISFCPEVSFFYRKLLSYSESENDGNYKYEYEGSISEFAISLPLMFQVTPVAGVPVYFTAGLQLDIPFKSEEEWTYTESYYGESYSESESKKIEKRSTLEFGIAIGAGYLVAPSVGIDFRTVIGLTPLTSESGDKSSLTQYGVGITFLL